MRTVAKRLTLVSLLLAAILPLYAQADTWSGHIDVRGTKLAVVFHLGGEHPTVDSPNQGIKGIPIQVDRAATGYVSIKIPSLGAAYEGMCMPQKIVGTFRQGGASFSLTLVPGEEKLNRPQTPHPPFPYQQEDVSFVNGDAVLSGTLVLPPSCTRETPVLIMVTGSGLQNRDEEIFEHRPFAVIADALARAGIATLRYDDRGFGASVGGDNVNCTTEDLKNDALAGVRLLRERFDHVGVIGHSEGGTIALMLAAEGQVDFIVSLAGMVVSGRETLVWQNRLAFTAAGYAESDVNTYCKLIAEAFDAQLNGTPLPPVDHLSLPEALKQNYKAVLLQLQSPYIQYFLATDMRPLLSRISCPVLALNGTKDTQVSAESNLEALRNGLPPNGWNKIETAEGLNHLFQHCATGSVAEYGSIEETFAPEVWEAMIQWIQALSCAW